MHFKAMRSNFTFNKIIQPAVTLLVFLLQFGLLFFPLFHICSTQIQLQNCLQSKAIVYLQKQSIPKEKQSIPKKWKNICLMKDMYSRHKFINGSNVGLCVFAKKLARGKQLKVLCLSCTVKETQEISICIKNCVNSKWLPSFRKRVSCYPRGGKC